MKGRRTARWLWLDAVSDHVRAGTLSPYAGSVAHVLAVHYVNGRNEAWPSQPELAAATGWSERTIRQALQELEQNGLLGARRGHPARTSGNVYRLRNGV